MVAVHLFAKMVKLTAEIIQQSYQYTNPIRERELDLRGTLICRSIFPLDIIHSGCFVALSYFLSYELCLHYYYLTLLNDGLYCFVGYKIPVIENLGATLVLATFLCLLLFIV